MSVEPLDVSSLQIIGYANVLPASALPSIVPPVFQRKDNPDSILVPPYSFNNGRYLCDATEISASEFESLQSRFEVTPFSIPIDAQRDHELWVDQQGRHQYQTRLETRRRMNQISAQELAKASTAFRNGQLDDAERHTSVALLADEQNFEALAIKIAIAQVKRDRASQDTLLELVPQYSLRAINSLVDELCRQHAAVR